MSNTKQTNLNSQIIEDKKTKKLVYECKTIKEICTSRLCCDECDKAKTIGCRMRCLRHPDKCGESIPVMK